MGPCAALGAFAPSCDDLPAVARSEGMATGARRRRRVGLAAAVSQERGIEVGRVQAVGAHGIGSSGACGSRERGSPGWDASVRPPERRSPGTVRVRGAAAMDASAWYGRRC